MIQSKKGFQYTMKIQYGLHGKRNKLRKNYGCLLFLVGLLFVQGVYGSNILLGLEDGEQREALQGLYVNVTLGNKPRTEYLHLCNSFIEIGNNKYNKVCDGGPGSKFCWSKSDDPVHQLILHDDGTLRKQINSDGEIVLITVFYKIDPEQNDDLIKEKNLEVQVDEKITKFWPANEKKMETVIDKALIKGGTEPFAELKGLVSEMISTFKIGSTLPTNTITTTKDTNAATKTNDTESTAFNPAITPTAWYENEKYQLGLILLICVIVVTLSLCCCCCTTNNTDPDNEDPNNHYPGSSDLVLEILDTVSSLSTASTTDSIPPSTHSTTNSTVEENTQSNSVEPKSITEFKTRSVELTKVIRPQSNSVEKKENTESQKESADLKKNIEPQSNSVELKEDTQSQTKSIVLEDAQSQSDALEKENTQSDTDSLFN